MLNNKMLGEITIGNDLIILMIPIPCHFKLQKIKSIGAVSLTYCF